MPENLNEIDELVQDPKFKKLHSYGMIDEIALRNFRIKKEYRLLRRKYSQVEAIYILSQKCHLSFDSINTILFRKRQLSLPHKVLSNL